MPVKRNIEKLKKRKAELENMIIQVSREIEDVEADQKIQFTDHAIVRYLERVKGINIDELKMDLVPHDVRLQILKLGGSGKFPVGTTHKVVVKKHTIITINI